LSSGDHTVQLFVSSGMIDFDAFQVSTTVSNGVIDPTDPIDFPDPGKTFYENTGVKLEYVGDWSTKTISNNNRVEGPGDGEAQVTSTPYDRMYATFTNADTIGIFRSVFSGGGTADVYLNGQYWGTMNNQASSQMITPYYISGLSTAVTYTVEVRLNPDTPRLEIDAIRLLNLGDMPEVYDISVPGPSDPMPPPIQVPFNGDQERVGWWGNYGNVITYSANEGDVLNVFFQGAAIAVKRQTGDRGIMELYVDGKLMRTVNNADSAPGDNQSVTVHGLDPYFPHVLQVRIHRTNPSDVKYVAIQGYTVFYNETHGPGSYEEYDYENGQPVRSDFIYDGDWLAPLATTGPSGGHLILSNKPNARAYFYFTGADSITVYGAAYTIGTADLYVNNKFKGSFNQYGSLAFNLPYTLTGFDINSVNVLEIRVNPSSPYSIALDRVLVFNRPTLEPVSQSQPRLYENNATVSITEPMAQDVPAMLFSGQWSRIGDGGASGGNYDQSAHSGDNVTFLVQNTSSVVLYRRLSSGYGKADVYVDGAYHSTMDNYTPVGAVNKVPYMIGGLDPGFGHRIVIKPAPGGNNPFAVDYIMVRAQDASGVTFLEDNYYENDNLAATSGGAISYGGNWMLYYGDHATVNAGDRAIVSFYGNAFTVYLTRFAAGGQFDLIIDGKNKGRYSAYAPGDVYDVPISIANLAEGMHTAELILVSGYIRIDGYRVHTQQAEIAQTYDLVSGNPPIVDDQIILSGGWAIADNKYLRTNEAGARIFVYATGGNTLVMTRQATAGYVGDIEIRVNGTLINTAKGNYPPGLGTQTENFYLGGIGDMMDQDVWIEIRTISSAIISIEQLMVTEMGPKLAAGCDVEAESSSVFTGGHWEKIYYGSLSGGYAMVSQHSTSRFYIPVQNVNYISVYRVIGYGGPGNVYIDGELWGKLPNDSSYLNPSVPYPIGPIPNPTDPHVIEIRPATSTAVFLDRVTCQNMPELSAGYYENDAPELSSAYYGSWSNTSDGQASGGSMKHTELVGSRLAVTFEGNLLTLYRRTSPYGGTMTAYVDGKEYPINNNSGGINYRVPHHIPVPGSNSGTHTLELVAKSGWLDLDAIEIGTYGPGSFLGGGAYQEDSPQVYINNPSGQQQIMTNAAYSGGGYVKPNQQYASVFFPFDGQRVTVYMTRGRYWGQASVFLDGERFRDVDLFTYNPANPYADYNELFYPVDITGLPRGNHVVEVRFGGVYSPYALPQINVDAFTVDGYPVPKPGEHYAPVDPDTGGGDGGGPDAPTYGCYEEARSNWVKLPDSSFWIAQQRTGASNNQIMYADTGTPYEVSAEFAFAAEGASLIFARDSAGGIAEIYLNGNLWTTGILPDGRLDMYSPVQELLEFARLDVPSASENPLDPDVVHVLSVVFTGDSNPSSSGTRVYIDRIDLPSYDPEFNCNWVPPEE
ncbi:MAG: hypothetical protein GYB65_00475, partial [Chloroflexi bacterium]|nr:hypothetical protein [Chloroflexota bacterium]